MPYISPDAQNRLSFRALPDLGFVLHNVGELTYVLFKVSKDYGTIPDADYARHAEVIAALDNAKEEYRRRFLNPYEDQKREENGDVWA